jgi:hypothetical protein
MKGQILFSLGIISLILSVGTQGTAKQSGASTATQNNQRTVKLRFEWRREDTRAGVQSPDVTTETVEISGLESSTLVSTNPIGFSSVESYRQCIANPTILQDGSLSITLSVYEWTIKPDVQSDRIERVTTTIKALDGEEKLIQTRTSQSGNTTAKFTFKVSPLVVK